MCVSWVQATFLRGASALSSRKAENPALAAELEELGDDQLDTRCRRNGLSKKGGREMQVCPVCLEAISLAHLDLVGICCVYTPCCSGVVCLAMVLLADVAVSWAACSKGATAAD